jgi:hypothetical protein
VNRNVRATSGFRNNPKILRIKLADGRYNFWFFRRGHGASAN